MATALFLLADLAAWSSCCPGLLCWRLWSLDVLQVVLSVKAKVLLGIQVSSWNAAALHPCWTLLVLALPVPSAV